MAAPASIILASASPTRKKLLQQIGLTFTVEASNFKEDHSQPLSPEDMVQAFAQGKARDVAARHKNATIIGADTLSLLDGQVMGKPADANDAARMLQALSGRAHWSLSGLTVINTATGQEISTVAKAEVHFRELSSNEISAYIASGEPFGKAGAYAIQEAGAAFIEKIVGEPYIPAGLPLAKLTQILHQMEAPILTPGVRMG